MNQAHYLGRIDHNPDAYYGADKHGAFYQATNTSYDPETDRTTVQFKPIPPADLPTIAADHMRQVEDKARLIEMFGGRW